MALVGLSSVYVRDQAKRTMVEMRSHCLKSVAGDRAEPTAWSVVAVLHLPRLNDGERVKERLAVAEALLIT